MYCWKVGKSSCIELFPITVFLSNHFWSQISICSAKIRNIPLKPAGATISVYLWKPQNVHGPKSTINLNYVLFINILFDNIHSWNHLQLVFVLNNVHFLRCYCVFISFLITAFYSFPQSTQVFDTFQMSSISSIPMCKNKVHRQSLLTIISGDFFSMEKLQFLQS